MAKKRRNKKESNENKNRALIIIAVVVLIIIIVIYFLSLGKFNYLKEGEDKKRIKWIDDRLNDLSVEVNSKLDLKKTLDEKVRRYFLYTRIAIVILIIKLNWIWYYIFGKVSVYSFSFCRPIDKEGITNTLATMLDFNQFLLLILFVILFLKFETLKEVKDVMRLIHLEVRRKVYRKHTGLDKEIQEINKEIEKLNQEKEEIKKRKNEEKNENDGNI